MSRLDFGSIFKRLSCLNSKHDQINHKNLDLSFKNLTKTIDESVNKSSWKLLGYGETALNKFIECMCDVKTASENYYKGFEIIESLSSDNFDKKISENFVNQFTNRILPYVENMEDVLNSIDSYDFSEKYVNSIKEAASNYLLADKILNNHAKISKRFNIEYEVYSAKTKGLTNVIESCCAMIDTYNIKLYQKFNMCIEEMVFLFEKNKIDYDQDKLCTSILEYFLLNYSDISEKDYAGFKYTLEHNECVDNIPSTYKFITESFDTTNIKTCIGNFLKNPKKSVELFESSFKDIIENTSVNDLKNNYGRLLEFTYKLYTSDVFMDPEYSSLKKSTEEVFQSIFDRCNNVCTGDEYESITRNDIINMSNKSKLVSSSIPVNSLTDDDIARKTDFKQMLANVCIKNCNELSNMLYDNKNLEAIRFVNEDTDPVPLSEFKIFKFNNLIKATKNLDKYINKFTAKKGKAITEKIKNTGKKVRDILFGNNDGTIDKESIYNFVGEDAKVDICVYQIETTSESDINFIQEELIEICEGFNYQLKADRLDNIRIYYTLNGCIAEVHLKDCTTLALTEEDKNMINISENPQIELYIDQLAIFNACNSIAESFNYNKSLDEMIVATFSDESVDMSLEAYDVAMDAMSLIGASKYQVDLFTESFSMYRNNVIVENATDIAQENKYIKSIYSNWKSEEDIPYDIQIEAAKILFDILTEAAPKVNKVKVGGAAIEDKEDDEDYDENDEEEDDDEEPDYSPIDYKNPPKPKDKKKKPVDKEKEFNSSKGLSNKLNNLKIYLHGLKSKAKNMGQKEQEISRQLDASFNNFAKSVKNAFISDRREAIIKGSVIPSFSKSLKIATSLALLGGITHNPVIPLAAALGGLITSKKLTKRERSLLLDEIEVELDVLDKEIANADSKNQIKKYRELLKYKKELQRQYQRIKYNIRVGKDILPGSAVGFKSRED